MSLTRFGRGIKPAILFSGLGLMLPFSGSLLAQAATPVFVELKFPAPTAVARYEVALSGQAFDVELHRASIRLAQDNFLGELTAAGIPYTLTSSALQAAGGTVAIPDRYADVEDNAEPGKGADRFTIGVVPSNGQSFQVSGLLGEGNIQVRIE